MVIRLLNHVENPAGRNLLGCAYHGRAEDVRQLLEERSGSVYDVQEYGHCPLQLALAGGYNTFQTVQLLLHAGADPNQEYDTGGIDCTPLAAAFRYFISGHPAQVEVSRLFRLNGFIDSGGYTMLHKIAMGILHVDLTKALQDVQAAASSLNKKKQGWDDSVEHSSIERGSSGRGASTPGWG
ncbi:hypothetical protein B0H66DRAFT_211219 [Apodospora peruviana]|uniref:Ankyrin repeat protein n=1 Tax=Apodospora peruviana TaxID=516989 RepID=A0AAE0IDB2_9PEZI|nr:hypothetical protein B0H66DRAFT_211219 [Apodospora peruviana]